MGESIMAASTNEDKIGGNAAPNRRLEVSVSFGRFENDSSLSWDKWSSFSQNKYLEEVEKCATPGSVAQKKAYFEAHYKKIAARKAELLDQKTVETGSPWKQHQNAGDSAGFCGQDFGFDVSNGLTDRRTEQGIELDGEFRSDDGDNEELNEDSSINIQGQDLLAERVESPTINKPEEAAPITEEATQSLELPNELDREMERISKFKEEPVKLNTAKESQKISPSSKVRDMAKMWRKPASTVAKSPQVSATKISKTAIASNTQRHKTPTKKVTGSPPPKNRICSIGGSKKVAPKSLHMSLSMDTPTPDPDPPVSTPFAAARKSFIMEKMKDKEIVKRAFKTFHNNFNQLRSAAEERSLASMQVPSKGSENRVSSSITPRKENAGSLKAVNMDKKTAKTAPSFGLRSYERAEKNNEKLQDKSKGKQSESTRLQTIQTKSKEEKDSDIRKSKYSLNFRAPAMPGFYQGQ